MTLIAALGASFVSLVGTKHRGFLYQNDSYHALNIANSGVEHAIRYISDGLCNQGSSYYGSQSISNVSFGGGSFTVARNYNLTTISSDNIDVTATYGSATRRVRLSSFRRYLTPLTLSPTQSPYRSWPYYTYVPLIGNQNASVSVSQIDLTVSESGCYLYRIFLINSSTGGSWSEIFNFSGSTFPSCATSSPPCRASTNGIRLPNGTAVVLDSSRGLSTHSIRPDETNWYIFEFWDWSTTPNGLYTVKSYTSPVASELRFTP